MKYLIALSSGMACCSVAITLNERVKRNRVMFCIRNVLLVTTFITTAVSTIASNQLLPQLYMARNVKCH